VSQTVEAPAQPTLNPESLSFDEPLWAVIVWNDDVNTFEHVIRAMVEILAHTVDRAEQLTIKVHQEGRSIVAVRPKEEAQVAVHKFLERRIQASLEQT
jgi:ATP-dependent Clp protease adaptor protein ClpS